MSGLTAACHGTVRAPGAATQPSAPNRAVLPAIAARRRSCAIVVSSPRFVPSSPPRSRPRPVCRHAQQRFSRSPFFVAVIVLRHLTLETFPSSFVAKCQKAVRRLMAEWLRTVRSCISRIINAGPVPQPECCRQNIVRVASLELPRVAMAEPTVRAPTASQPSGPEDHSTSLQSNMLVSRRRDVPEDVGQACDSSQPKGRNADASSRRNSGNLLGWPAIYREAVVFLAPSQSEFNSPCSPGLVRHHRWHHLNAVTSSPASAEIPDKQTVHHF